MAEGDVAEKSTLLISAIKQTPKMQQKYSKQSSGDAHDNFVQTSGQVKKINIWLIRKAYSNIQSTVIVKSQDVVYMYVVQCSIISKSNSTDFYESPTARKALVFTSIEG